MPETVPQFPKPSIEDILLASNGNKEDLLQRIMFYHPRVTKRGMRKAVKIAKKIAAKNMAQTQTELNEAYAGVKRIMGEEQYQSQETPSSISSHRAKTDPKRRPSDSQSGAYDD